MDMDIHMSKVVYSRTQLLALRTKSRTGVAPHLPDVVRRPYRSCRAGAKLKAKSLAKKWRYKPPVPSVIMGNVNSLPNKIDKLAELLKNVNT